MAPPRSLWLLRLHCPRRRSRCLCVKLFPLVAKSSPERANGALLELDNSLLLTLLDSEQLFRWKVDEAIRIMDQVAPTPQATAR